MARLPNIVSANVLRLLYSCIIQCSNVWYAEGDQCSAGGRGQNPNRLHIASGCRYCWITPMTKGPYIFTYISHWSSKPGNTWQASCAYSRISFCVSCTWHIRIVAHAQEMGGPTAKKEIQPEPCRGTALLNMQGQMTTLPQPGCSCTGTNTVASMQQNILLHHLCNQHVCNDALLNEGLLAVCGQTKAS